MVNSTLQGVREVLGQTLGIEDRALGMPPEAPLMDSIPELDSMAVVEVLVKLEERFGIQIDDSDVTGDMFETLGSLTSFVDQHRGSSGV